MRRFNILPRAPICGLVALFLIGCSETTEPESGGIRVSLTMTGGEPDADGCWITVDSGPSQVLEAEESYTFAGLSTGTHDVTITDVAPNCMVQGETSRAVAVTASQTTAVQFSLDCPKIVEGIDLDELFAEPTQAEAQAILDAWGQRDVSAKTVQTVLTRPEAIGTTPATLRIVSHVVDEAEHYGAILVPDGAAAASLPVLVYSHGGDGGVDVDELLPLIPYLLGGLESEFVFVAPSFRAEPLVYDGTSYLSEGAPSPWDRDVDDALALLSVALSGLVPEADPDRVGVIGFSRGASVGLLMAERDTRIDLVVEFFGPTDFFGPFVQDVVEEALRGQPRDLPGLDYLNAQFIQPLKRGELTIADVRPELVRRSPVLYAGRLPPLQVHHGTNDPVVPVSEAERLIDVMQELGRGEPEFEHYIYPGGTHNPLTLSGSLERTRTFVSRLLTVAQVTE